MQLPFPLHTVGSDDDIPKHCITGDVVVVAGVEVLVTWDIIVVGVGVGVVIDGNVVVGARVIVGVGICV